VRDAIIELTEKLSELGMSQEEIFELLERFLFQETSKYLKTYEEAAAVQRKMNTKIEHVALYVNDLETARNFFIKYLEGESNDGYHNPKTGFRSYFISFNDGSRLEIMNKPDMVDDPKDLNRTGYVHIAFSAGSKERVDELTQILRDDGYEVLSGPRTTGDGYYESCIVAIEGNQIEITV